MNKLMLHQLSGAVVLVFLVQSLAAADNKKPNIVILLADDLGWGAVSYHSEFAKTPNVDRFVKKGIELDRFYVAPMCSPTRAGLLTGRYPIRFGLARAVIPPQRNFGLPVNELTLPKALADAGYVNRGIFGKWHLGHHDIQWHPLSRGFTKFEGHYNGAIDYFDLTREGERDWHENYRPSLKKGYATDLIADAASQFILDSAKSESPYFCYVPFNAPHAPFQAKPEDIERFRNEKNERKQAQILKAMIWSMDQGIGKILSAVEQSGEADNTQIWFFSDNGGVKSIKKNNLPLRGSKLSTFEGGIRVTAAVSWPARWKSGRKINNVMGYIDVFPTILKSTGSDPHDVQKPNQPFDGIELDQLFSGTKTSTADRHWYSYHGQAGEEKETISVRNDKWKLIVNGPNIAKHQISPQHQIFLFEIEKDPYEKNNLAKDRPQIKNDLLALVTKHRQLQPANGIPIYGAGKKNFIPWKNWNINH